MTITPDIDIFQAASETKELRPGVTLEIPGPNDQEAVTTMLNGALRPDSQISVERDLPLLVGPGATSYRRIVRTEGRIVAHAALYVHSYRLLNHAFNVGVIGAVATTEEERGRGFASAVVSELTALLPQYNTPMCVLWSDAPEFYERLGFVSGGREVIYPATPENMPMPAADIKVREATRADLPALRIIHNQEPSLTVRTSQEWETWMQLPETGFYVLENRAGIISYGVVGKGQDLQGCIHEWGGPDHQLAPLVGGILALRGDPELFVMSPPWKRTAHAIMTALGVEPTMGLLGMMHLPDPEGFCQNLETHHIDPAMCDDPGTLIPALFGRGDEPTPENHTPLPFYLFGLDSM